jgi:hypothetical protein
VRKRGSIECRKKRKRESRGDSQEMIYRERLKGETGKDSENEGQDTKKRQREKHKGGADKSVERKKERDRRRDTKYNRER